VSWRRSAVSVRGGAGAAADVPVGLPQPPQNRAAGSLTKPQNAQASGSIVPHWAQNRLVAAFSAEQFGQSILRFQDARGDPPEG
jgi:hypothetical protein